MCVLVCWSFAAFLVVRRRYAVLVFVYRRIDMSLSISVYWCRCAAWNQYCDYYELLYFGIAYGGGIESRERKKSERGFWTDLSV